MILSLLAASSDQTPWLQQNNPAIWSSWGGSVWRSTAGEKVTPDSALGLPAYWACIQVLSQDEAKLPIRIKREIGTNKTEVLRTHPYVKLLNRMPNPNSTAITLREFLISQCAGWGNGYAEIVLGGTGLVEGLVPIPTAALQPEFDPDGYLIWKREGRNGTKIYRSEQLIHICGPTQNGYIGSSVAYHANECIGTGLAQQKYRGAFFGNGAMPLVVLKHPAKVNPQLRDEIRSDWERMHGGGAENAHRTAVLPEAMEAQVLSVNPRDAQLIEASQATISDVCRWFRMPPGKIQHFFQAKGWDSSEAENQHYLVDTLMPWLERVEAELDRKLFPDGEAYCEHDPNRMLRANSSARSEYLTKMTGNGIFTINDALQYEGMDDGGPECDVRLVPVNMQPLERAIKGPEPAPAAPPPNQPEPEDEEDDEEEEAKPRGQLGWVMHTLERAMRKETKAVTRFAQKHAGQVEAYMGELTKFARAMIGEICAELKPLTTDAVKADHVATVVTAYCSLAIERHRDPAKVAESLQVRALKLNHWARAIDSIAEA